MAVPKRRTSRAKRDQRRAQHDRVSPPNLIECPTCGDLTLPHRICPECGHYKGRKLMKGRADKLQERAARAEAAAAAAAEEAAEQSGED